jgi:hypothetical protein
MSRVNTDIAVPVYCALNHAYANLISVDDIRLLSSSDRSVIACFLYSYADRAESKTMNRYWRELAYSIAYSKPINQFDMELITEVIFAALTAACNVLRNSGVRVNDENQAFA